MAYWVLCFTYNLIDFLNSGIPFAHTNADAPLRDLSMSFMNFTDCLMV